MKSQSVDPATISVWRWHALTVTLCVVLAIGIVSFLKESTSGRRCRC